MTINELIRLSLAGKYPLSIYWEMRRGLWRIAKRRLFSKRNANKERPSIAIEEIRAALNKTNIEKTDSVFIHSGIGNIGIVEGGRRALFELLLEFVNPNTGNLLFPTFSLYPRMYDYLESSPVFDVRTAPSYMGSVTQYALKTKMGVRSIHPTHSVLVIGKDADNLAREHHVDITPFGPNSPFQKMLELDGAKILLIGVSTDVITYIHAVEDMMGEKFPVRTYTDKVYEIKCFDWDGRELMVKTKCHTPVISLARDITRFDNKLRERGIMGNEIPIGLSSIGVLDANGFCDFLTELAGAGETVYGRTNGGKR